MWEFTELSRCPTNDAVGIKWYCPFCISEASCEWHRSMTTLILKKWAIFACVEHWDKNIPIKIDFEWKCSSFCGEKSALIGLFIRATSMGPILGIVITKLRTYIGFLAADTWCWWWNCCLRNCRRRIVHTTSNQWVALERYNYVELASKSIFNRTLNEHRTMSLNTIRPL